MSKNLLTFIDSGVLIAAARGTGAKALAAFSVLDGRAALFGEVKVEADDLRAALARAVNEARVPVARPLLQAHVRGAYGPLVNLDDRYRLLQSALARFGVARVAQLKEEVERAVFQRGRQAVGRALVAATLLTQGAHRQGDAEPDGERERQSERPVAAAQKVRDEGGTACGHAGLSQREVAPDITRESDARPSGSLTGSVHS